MRVGGQVPFALPCAYFVLANEEKGDCMYSTIRNGRLLGAAVAIVLALVSAGAWACIGRDGSLPPFGGSRANGFMVDKVKAAWADADAKGTIPLTPPVSGTHRVLILLVQNASSGATFAYPAASLWTQRLADIAAYYTEVSKGVFTVTAANETWSANSGAVNDGVVGPVTVSTFTSSSDVTWSNSLAIVTKAVQAADSYVNFASFDTDGDGVLAPDELHLLVYLAGDETSYASSSLPRAWAHETWQRPYMTGLAADGVKLTGYCCCGSEFNGSKMAEMGPMTHELGHDLGLPDLYDVDGTTSGYWFGLGGFSLMASGSWGGYDGDVPVHIDGFLKSWLGWASVTTLTAPGDRAVSLAAAKGSNAVLRLNVTGSQEFFIIENRQRSGYDAGLPSSPSPAKGGLAIYHCDGAILTAANIREENYVNTSSSSPGIRLEEASTSYGTLSQNPNTASYDPSNDKFFFRSSNNGTFSASSTPNSNLKTGTASNIALTSISESATTMTLNVGVPISLAISAPSESLTAAGPVSYTLTYTGATAITLSASDISLVAAGSATGTVTVDGSGSTTRTATISNITGEGRLTIAVAANTANDGAGHYAVAASAPNGFWVTLDLPVVMWPVVPLVLAAGVALIARRKRA